MVTARVVVVGAGPSGLAAAFLLAKARCSVTLIDRLAEPWIADHTRAFSYLVAEHGLPTLERMGLLDALKDAGVAASEVHTLTYSPRKAPSKAPPFTPPDDTTPRHFIARERLLKLMLDHVREQGLVELRFGASVGTVTYSRAGASVQLLDSNGRPLGMVHADLILACDGMRSSVRRQLSAGGSNVESTGSFELQRMTSPATRLVYKSLAFVPSPLMPPLEKGENQHTVLPTELVQLRARRSTLSQMQFTFFPVGNDSNLPRIASLATHTDADVWRTNNAEEAYAVLQDHFPQVDMRKLVEPEQMAAFAANKPSQFPCIQRCESLAAWRGENVGVALLGDAAKCFPPDLAQGLNSSLEDVAVLVDAVAEASCVREAVQLYEARRSADITALMRLMQIGFPYQYRQNVPMYNLSMTNFVFRSILAQVAPRVFNPPAIVLVSSSQYAEAIRKADETTSRLQGILLASAALGLGILLARRRAFR